MTRFGLVSTYPPTRCGLATFTEALATELSSGAADTATIVRVIDGADQDGWVTGERSPVSAKLLPGRPDSMDAAVAALDACDVAIVQHEYGIYGGADGDEAVTLLERLSVPVIVVLHTVLASPTASQRRVLQAVCAASASVVVMSDNAAGILRSVYRVDESKVSMIPHGVRSQRAGSVRHASGVKRVVTWGLISEGKGLEWGIRAVALLRDRHLAVEYVIAGRTHPKVVEYEGERYRRRLERLVVELGLEGAVHLDDRYLGAAELAELQATADAVLLPYMSQEQATSGVLAEAVAEGVPVIATRFPHAVELLSGGAGLIVEQSDPKATADALERILTSDETARAMRDAALRGSRLATWPVVAAQYRLLAAPLTAVHAA